MTEITGTVVRGKGLGRKLGYPTANVVMSMEDSLLSGVYAADILLGGEHYKGAAALMPRKNQIEVHIIDYPDKDLYNQEITISLREKVSEMEKCESQGELQDKIKQDIEKIKKQA